MDVNPGSHLTRPSGVEYALHAVANVLNRLAAAASHVAPWRARAWTAILETMWWLWPAYVVGSLLILTGFTWSLPDGQYVDKSFQADENGAVGAVRNISFPWFNPRWLPWGTGFFYQVYAIKTVVTLGGLLPIDDFWVLVIGRLVSYASAMAIITLVFVLGRHLFDAWVGAAAALMLSVLPGFVVAGHYMKNDIPMTCWLLAAMLAAFTVNRTRAPWRLVVLGLLVGYAASMKYSAGVMYPVGLVAIAMGGRPSIPVRRWMSYTGCVAAGFLFGTPYALRVNRLVESLQWVARLNRGAESLYTWDVPPPAIDYFTFVMPFSMTLPMLLVSAAALTWAIVRYGRRLLPIWVFLVVYFPLLASDNARLVRYTVPLLPFAALLVAAALGELKERPVVGRIARLGFACLLLYAFGFSLSYVRAMAAPDARAQANAWIDRTLPGGALVAVSTEHYLNVPQVALIGRRKVEVGLDAAAVRDADTPWLVLSQMATRFEPDALEHRPKEKAFLDYVEQQYTEVAWFENSQRVAGIDSKPPGRLPQDWLIPNPRIRVLKRQERDSRQPPPSPAHEGPATRSSAGPASSLVD